MIAPHGNRVLVRPEEGDDWAGSVLLPEIARSYPQRGEVVAIGSRVREAIEPGDMVLYSKYFVGAEVTEDGSPARWTHPDGYGLLIVDVDRIHCVERSA